MPAGTLVLAASAIYGGIDAAERRKKAQNGIEKLKRFKPKYRSAEDIQNEAEARITTGYSPSERANFEQSMARRSNQARRIATDRNPNLSGAINAGINYGNIQGELGFAANDAALRRQRVSEMVGRITGQSNAQTGADITTKMQQEIAYGNAKNQANADIYNSLMQLGYAGASAATRAEDKKAYDDAIKKGLPPPATNAPSQPPLRTATNQLPPVAGTDAWATGLYGNPNPQAPAPQFYGSQPGTYQFGVTQPVGRPINGGIPSRQASPYSPYPDFYNYYR